MVPVLCIWVMQGIKLNSLSFIVLTKREILIMNRNQSEEAVELLTRGDANQPDFAKMDLQLKEKFEELSKQIAERSNFLAKEKLEQENIQYMEWKSKIQTPLDQLRYQMNYLNSYIYRHATQFSCCTSKAEKLQAKEDAKQAYTIIQKIISQSDYPIDQQNIDLFKIHNHNIRNGVILIIAGIVLLAVAFSIIIGGPFIFAALTAGVLLAKSTMIAMPFILAAVAMVPIAGGMLLGGSGIAKFDENRRDKTFRDHFNNSLSGFFHNDVKTLLPNNDVAASSSEPTVECTQ